MPVYRLIKKNVPNQSTGTRENKFYAQPVSMGHSTLKMIADSIAQSTLINQVDVEAVLLALFPEVTTRLMQGQIVDLPPLGSFRLGLLNAGGTATKEAWTPSLIRCGHIIFTAYKDLYLAARNAKWTRWIGDATAKNSNPMYARVAAEEQRLEKLKADLLFAEEYANKTQKSAEANPKDNAAQIVFKAAEVHVEELQALIAESHATLKEEQKLFSEWQTLSDKVDNRKASKGKDYTQLHIGAQEPK